MKRILIFSLAYYPDAVSGAEAAIKEITDRIDPNDIEFHMLTLRFGPERAADERIGTVHVHRLGPDGSYRSKILLIPRMVLHARSLHRRYHFDAIWAMMTYMLFPVALLRVSGVRIPHILTLQDGDSYEKVFQRPFIRPVAPLLDYGFRTAAIVQAISAYLAEWPRKRGYRGEVVLVYNGANPKALHEAFDMKHVESIRRRFNKQEGDVWLTNTARLEYQKAFDTTVRALPLLPAHVKFLIVGGGSDEAMLKTLVKELRVEDRVFFTGKVERAEVSDYRKAADIFVAPSRSEGLGLAFLSAMATRLPVVATQEGGLADFIFDATRNPDKRTTAWAVDKDKPEQIAEAVTDILAHPDKVRAVTDDARAMVLETFDWDKIAVQMREKVFAKVIG